MQVHLYECRPNGSLLPLFVVGEQCFADDGLYLSQTLLPDAASCAPATEPPQLASLSAHLEQSDGVFAKPGFITGLKHRLLAYLYRQTGDDMHRRREFYFQLPEYASLAIWQMQLLGGNILLLKYAPEQVLVRFRNDDNPLRRMLDAPGMPALFAFYDYVSGQMLAVLDNDNQELLGFYQACAWLFTGTAELMPYCQPRGHADSYWRRQQLRDTLHLFLTSRNGGQEQAVRRGLCLMLPTPLQWRGCTSCPYLDPDLFSYDEKCITRARHASGHTFNFYSRARQKLAFTLDSNAEANDNARRVRKRTIFFFHPFLPLVLSVQVGRRGRKPAGGVVGTLGVGVIVVGVFCRLWGIGRTSRRMSTCTGATSEAPPSDAAAPCGACDESGMLSNAVESTHDGGHGRPSHEHGGKRKSERVCVCVCVGGEQGKGAETAQKPGRVAVGRMNGNTYGHACRRASGPAPEGHSVTPQQSTRRETLPNKRAGTARTKAKCKKTKLQLLQ
jgi:hypothetical protein